MEINDLVIVFAIQQVVELLSMQSKRRGEEKKAK